MGVDVAWRMPPGPVADQKAENRCEPNEPVSIEDLRDLGVLHWRLNPDTMLQAGPNGEPSPVDKICRDMGYKNRDCVTCSPDKLPNYEAKLQAFFEEHIHEDDEIRLILDGVGYFDVRDAEDRWVRIRMQKGDLIVLPAGIYHRFTMDGSDFTQAMRLFKEVPVWTPINRPCDEHAVRQAYLHKFVIHPATPETVVGPAKGDDALYLSHPERFDAMMRVAIASLRSAQRDVLVVYATGIHNPETKQSWCPDCVKADPVVAASIRAARAADPSRRVVLLEAAVERSAYLNNPEYVLRTHPFVQLRSIPTVIVALANDPTADEPGITVVDRSEEPTDAWVEKVRLLGGSTQPGASPA